MSLSYDFEKNIILGLIATTITLIVGLVLITHGQTTNESQVESYKALINYCFQHADRPNPLQDLIDKGLLSETFTGDTCKSVKQTYDIMASNLAIQKAKEEKALLEQQAKQEKEFADKQERSAKYIECARQDNTTQEECSRLLNATTGR